MKPGLVAAGLAPVMAALIVFLGVRRKAWIALLGFAAALAVAGAAGLGADGPVQAASAATGMALASAALASELSASKRSQALREERGAVREKLAHTTAALAEAKALGLKTDQEEKETLVLYDLAKTLPESLSWGEIRPRLEGAAAGYLGVEEFALYAASEDNRTPRLVSLRRLEGSPGASWATLARCLQEQGLSLDRPQTLQKPEPAVALPIMEGNEALGYFYARIPRGADAAGLLAKARTFVSEVSFAFRRVRLFQEVESLSRLDGLTGVHRRGDFEERIRYEVARARTFKAPCALMILDIDHFKELNDRYGHPFGDRVLKRIGEILNVSFYETDYVARYGGEEFAVILPRADAEGVARKAESVRRTIEAERLEMGFEAVKVTASIGLAFFPRDASAPEDLIARADAALYRAKSAGRNRVVDVARI